MSTKKQGGMYSVADAPYNPKIETMETCDDVTRGKAPVVGIEGWTQLPTNNYKATMNAVAKVCAYCMIMSTFTCVLSTLSVC
jgi:hypothetical protein